MSENVRVVKVRAFDAEGDGFNIEQRMIYSDKKVPNDIWFTLDDGTIKCMKNYQSADVFGDDHDDWQPLDNIMLSTGKKDKNEKDIYECDIIRIEDGKTVNLVRYDEERAMFVLDEYALDESTNNFNIVGTYTFDYFQNELIKCRIEIIGNIYENPELVKFRGE